MMEAFLTSNEWPWCLTRIVVQGALGVVAANVDTLVGCAVLEPEWRVVVVALVMAVLAPVMAELGAARAAGGGSSRARRSAGRRCAARASRRRAGRPGARRGRGRRFEEVADDV